MYIIRIRYLPATNYKGSRLKVQADGYPPKEYSYNECEDGGEIGPDIFAAKRYAKQVIAAHTIRTSDAWHFQTVRVPCSNPRDGFVAAMRDA